LKNISLGYPHPDSRAEGFHPFDKHRWGGHLKQTGPFQPVGLVQTAFRVAHDGKLRRKVSSKGLRLFPVSHAHQYNLSPDFIESAFCLTQLRHLLSAKRSAEVPQKDQNKRAFFPQFFEFSFGAV
jgi:hypothetical protein